jgi:hypothetical protein
LTRLKRRQGQPPLTEVQSKKLKKGYAQLYAAYIELKRVDFFPTIISRNTHQALQQVAKQLEASHWEAATTKPPKQYSTKTFQGKLWATRKHIHIDRLCSAWLIKRFIDPKARFVFISESKLPDNVIPFDVFGKEFSHHGDDCTFETIIKAFQLRDKSLITLAEIVHDIDIKDGKFGRPEAAGIDIVVRSLSDSLNNDHRTVEVGSILLDTLYERFSQNNKTKRK